MITDLKRKIKFLRGQVANKDTYFHEEMKYLRQQLETVISKQENSNISFCNNLHPQCILSNIVNFDNSIISTDCHTKVTGSESNIQTDIYIKNETTKTSLYHLQ